MIVTLLASFVFFMIARRSEQTWLFYGFSGVCFLYTLFAAICFFTCNHHRRLDQREDVKLYKTSCPSCGELLAGHELYCPKCGAFLPKRIHSKTQETNEP